MEMIYLGDKKDYSMPQGTFTIDRVPPKSTYMDRNRSNMVISETFESPSKEVMEKLYASAEEFFKKMKINEEILRKASKAEIIREISLVDDEINDEMHPVSHYRYHQLSEYKKRLEEELRSR